MGFLLGQYSFGCGTGWCGVRSRLSSGGYCCCLGVVF